MKPEELRIGNWVNYADKQHKWALIDFVEYDPIAHNYYDDIHPIPLTEESLKQFFKCQHNEEGNYYTVGEFDIKFKERKAWFGGFDHWVPNFPEYIHELQNLHFAMYKIELETIA